MIKLLLAAILCLILINSSDCQEELKDSKEKEEGTMDVLDTMAWASNWFMALGLYAGRQPRRGYGRFDLVDDLPKIFIPNELTGNEIVRAIKTTGKQQMLTENNMLLDYLDFMVSQNKESTLFFNGTNSTSYYDYDYEEGIFVETSDNHFAMSENFLDHVEDMFNSTGFLVTDLDEEMKETILSFLGDLRLRKKHDSWESMVNEANDIYQDLMKRFGENGGLGLFKKQEDDSLYSMTNKAREFLHGASNFTFFTDYNGYICSSMFRNEYCIRKEELDTDYNKFREYEKTLERVKQMVDGSVTILRLPSELSWDNIKQALQATYKRGIQQISVYQFLVRNKEFLDLESGVKGMSLLSDQLTGLLMSEMGYLFRYLTPIGFY